MTMTMLNPSRTRPNHTVAPRVPQALLREPCDLEVVIPSFNEERRLPATLTEIVRELAALEGIHSRVVIVDNGSSDRTAEVVDAARRDGGPEIVVIGCSTRGKGAAVQRGMSTSQASVVGFVDADLSVSPTFLGEAYARVIDGADVVIASRRCEGARIEVSQPVTRRLGGWVFRSAIGSLMPGVADSQCGFKFFSLSAAREIFHDMKLTGFAFDVEALMRAARLGHVVDELPVVWTDDENSTLGLVSHAPEIARDILRLHMLDSKLGQRSRFMPSCNVVIDQSAISGVGQTFEAVHTVTAARPRPEDGLRVA